MGNKRCQKGADSVKDKGGFDFMADMIHPFGKKIHDLAEVIPVNCTGCGICAMWCVMHCIDQQPDGIYRVREADCIGCRSCKVNCPNEAVTMLPPKRPEQEV